MSTPLFSFIMPAKDRAHLIGAAIKSIIDQTLDDWELIVVDDHSADNTHQVITQFTDNRIRYFRLASGTGPGAARHFGIAQAKGTLIALSDSDDINVPQRLELTKQAIDTTNADVVYGNMWAVDIIKHKEWLRSSQVFDLKLLHCINYIPTSTVAFTKAAYENAGGFTGDIFTSEDYDLWLKMTEVGLSFYHIDHVLARMQVHPQSITQSSNIDWRKNNLAIVRAMHNLPVPDQETTLRMIKDTELRKTFSSQGAKRFWFAAYIDSSPHLR